MLEIITYFMASKIMNLLFYRGQKTKISQSVGKSGSSVGFEGKIYFIAFSSF